jgi:hypothetical protein
MLIVRVPRGRLAAAGLLVVLACAALAGGCGRGIFRHYEYDEDIYLSLDGSATLYVNASLAALDALRGFDLDLDPGARFDRQRIAALFAGPGIRVIQITSSRQHGRRFAHLRLEVSDVRKLQSVHAFSWATVRFDRLGDLYRYREELGPSANRPIGAVGWTGDELVSFRLHLPSKIAYHNAGRDNLLRGNILLWEQSLKARLAGEPLEMEARMEPTSILYYTLWLFAGSLAAAFTVLALIIWWIVKRGKDKIEDVPAG